MFVTQKHFNLLNTAGSSIFSLKKVLEPTLVTEISPERLLFIYRSPSLRHD